MASPTHASPVQEDGSQAREPAKREITAEACTIPEELSIEVGGQTRRVVVRKGTTAAAGAPLLFAWHGWGSNPEQMLRAVDPQTHWDDAIVVAPQGAPRTFEGFGDTPRDGWQIVAGEFDDRDLALFDALREQLGPCIDPARVYTTGFSNGGFFSNLLACARRDVVAAAAPVGGGGPGPEGCGGAVPVMVTHGRRDDVVPFDMGKASFDTWTKLDGCTATDLPPTGCVDAAGCQAPVRMCVFDGGHRWPRGTAASVAKFLRKNTRAQG